MKKLSSLLFVALGLAFIPALSAAETKATAPKDAAVDSTAKEAPVGAMIERKAGGFINLCVDRKSVV